MCTALAVAATAMPNKTPAVLASGGEVRAAGVAGLAAEAYRVFLQHVPPLARPATINWRRAQPRALVVGDGRGAEAAERPAAPKCLDARPGPPPPPARAPSARPRPRSPAPNPGGPPAAIGREDASDAPQLPLSQPPSYAEPGLPPRPLTPGLPPRSLTPGLPAPPRCLTPGAMSEGAASAASLASGLSGEQRASASFERRASTSCERRASISFDPVHLKFVRPAGAGSFARVSICDYDPLAPPSTGGAPSSVGDGEWSAGMRVAVKSLNPSQGAAAAASLVAEGEMLAGLDHPNIVACYGGGVGGSKHNGKDAAAALSAARARPFIVQQCVDGGTLRDVVIDQMSRAGRAYPPTAALAWAADVAAGLEYLHSQSPPIAHRDLKLENILLTKASGPSGHPVAVIADFGLARSMGDGGDDAADDGAPDDDGRPKRRVRNLDPTACTGSFLYMSPEVLRGEAYDASADVFSLGCMIAELFTGVITSTVVVGPTFNPRAAQAFAVKVAAGYRRPLPASVPPSVRAVINGCWEADPAARPTAGAVRAALEAARPDIESLVQATGPACGACALM